MSSSAMASGPSRSLIVHTSTAQIGGAEVSLLEAVAESQKKPFFLVPAEGPLTRELRSRGLDFAILPWPRGLAGLTQGRWRAFPLALPGLVPYLFRLHAAARTGAGGDFTLWSSGLKSHCTCLALAPWLGSAVLFDIRDFLKPRFLRRLIAAAAARFGCRVRANSRSVARDYPGADVHYPIVKKPSGIAERNGRPGKRIIAHLAYFAPYKGQDLFLACARRLLDAGLDAEFWVIGDVIYPAPSYARYRERIFAESERLGLSAHVRFLGKIGGGEEISALLGRTDLLLHCTREPEPYGRAVMEALLCGCEAICHKDSGVCEVATVSGEFPEWAGPLRDVLGPEYVRLALRITS